MARTQGTHDGSTRRRWTFALAILLLIATLAAGLISYWTVCC
jgi:hypothetical protein